MTKISMVSVRGEGLSRGWKVYLDGKKYPRKPETAYWGVHEAEAVRLAFLEAGLDTHEIAQIDFAE